MKKVQIFKHIQNSVHCMPAHNIDKKLKYSKFSMPAHKIADVRLKLTRICWLPSKLFHTRM